MLVKASTSEMFTAFPCAALSRQYFRAPIPASNCAFRPTGIPIVIVASTFARPPPLEYSFSTFCSSFAFPVATASRMDSDAAPPSRMLRGKVQLDGNGRPPLIAEQIPTRIGLRSLSAAIPFALRPRTAGGQDRAATHVQSLLVNTRPYRVRRRRVFSSLLAHRVRDGEYQGGTFPKRPHRKARNHCQPALVSLRLLVQR